MEMIQVEIAAGFPVRLLCLSDGTVILSAMGQFPTYVENTPAGVSSAFDPRGFWLKLGSELDYQPYYYDIPYKYKEMPMLKAWLVQQNLINPLTGQW